MNQRGVEQRMENLLEFSRALKLRLAVIGERQRGLCESLRDALTPPSVDLLALTGLADNGGA